MLEAFYGFGDASGPGFGLSFDGSAAHYVYYWFRQWSSQISEELSNFRKLKNLVDALKDFVVEHNLGGVKTFLLTNNSVAEAAYLKGNSSLCKLVEFVLELKEFERDLGLLIYVIHVNGKRMIAQGTDSLEEWWQERT